MRTFETGATRDGNINKLDFEGFFSPVVLERYARYLHKHRKQADGKMRDSDNWQKGIPLNTYMKSKIRHGVATWLLHRGFPAFDDRGEPVDLEDSLCAEVFNAMGYLFELLKEKQQVKPEWITNDKVKYCSDCEKRIAAAGEGELVPMCKVCQNVTSHVLVKSSRKPKINRIYCDLLIKARDMAAELVDKLDELENAGLKEMLRIKYGDTLQLGEVR